MAAPATRAIRSDGIRSREAILRTAASLASTRGIEELSIGELAASVGMSKSGLYAHFGSKEELQLATVEAAKATFTDVVLEPVAGYPPGVDGLVALSDAFCEHIREKVFPGGCFFDAAAADFTRSPVRSGMRWAGSRATGGLVSASTSKPRPPQATCQPIRTSTSSSSRSSPSRTSPTSCSGSKATSA